LTIPSLQGIDIYKNIILSKKHRKSYAAGTKMAHMISKTSTVKSK